MIFEFIDDEDDDQVEDYDVQNSTEDQEITHVENPQNEQEIDDLQSSIHDSWVKKSKHYSFFWFYYYLSCHCFLKESWHFDEL